MSIKFLPIGELDINTDPSVLPGVATEKVEISGAMRRCTNLKLDAQGKAETRDGSNKVNTTAMSQTFGHLLEVMVGVRYSFVGTNIFNNETSIVSGLTSAQWSAIQYNSFNDTTKNIFALNGTDRKRIDGSNVNEWGIEGPTVAPVLATGALTGLTGDYNAKYTYVRKVGTTVVSESNPSAAAAAAVTLANESLSITCTAPSDSQVTHIRIYRTLAGGTSYLFDQELVLPTVTLDSDTADLALGTAVEINHDRPPIGTVVLGPAYNGYCFILKDNLLNFCLANRPEYWPTDFNIEVGNLQLPLKAGAFYNAILYCMTESEMFIIQGTGSNTFFPYPLAAQKGALWQEGVVAVKGRGIYRVLDDGIYLFDGKDDNKITEEKFDAMFQGITVGSIPGVNTSEMANAWLKHFNNRLYFGYPQSGSTYADNILVMNLLTKKVQHYDYSQTFKVIDVDKTNRRLLALDNSGFVWHIENDSQTTDNSVAISWQIESKSYTDAVRKYFPRYAKYDVELGTGGSATASVLLNDTSIQDHSLTESRQTKRRLIDNKNGDRLGVRIVGSGVATIRSVEIE